MFHRPKTEEQNASSSQEAKTTQEPAAEDLEQNAPAQQGHSGFGNMNIPAFVQKTESKMQPRPVSAPQSSGNTTSDAAPAPSYSAQQETTTPQRNEQQNQNVVEEDRSMTQDHSFQNPTQAGQPRSADIPSGGSYGQGGTGSYQSGVYQPSAQGQSSTSVSDGRQLVIGQGITMSGEIEACENLVVEGTVEAALKGARVLEITETGVFYGAVEIEEATIAGRFEGDITVNGKLTVLSTGMITGSIVYKDLAVDAGAVIDGKISPLSAEGAAKGTKGDSRKASVKSKISKSSSANESGSELPFSGSTAVAAE